MLPAVPGILPATQNVRRRRRSPTLETEKPWNPRSTAFVL